MTQQLNDNGRNNGQWPAKIGEKLTATDIITFAFTKQ